MSIMDFMTILLIIMVMSIGILGVVYVLMYKKSKEKGNKDKQDDKDNKKNKANGANQRSVKDFMEFDKVEDGMIMCENETKYLMVLQCHGINYYLMSDEEKLAVEQGFIQMLNTLRYPIQLYVQSRRTNLSESIENYKGHVTEIKGELDSIETQINMLKSIPNSDKDTIAKLEYDYRKKRNIYEYGVDITDYITGISLNKNILQRQFYIIIPYYTSEIGLATSFTEDEKKELCYTELYTRCRSLATALTACSVESKILNSEELCELLYIAYNRDDSTLLDLRKVIAADSYRLYSTSKDILTKKQEIIDKEIVDRALDKAQDAINRASSKQIIKNNFDKKFKKDIDRTAIEIIDNSKEFFSSQVIENAKKLIKDIEKNNKPKRTIKSATGKPDEIIARIINKQQIIQNEQERIQNEQLEIQETKPRKRKQKKEAV